jgi:hypothetical protein
MRGRRCTPGKLATPFACVSLAGYALDRRIRFERNRRALSIYNSFRSCIRTLFLASDQVSQYVCIFDMASAW